MLNIYNKILKEALDIMDFDSWDDSEQTFKDNIKKSLNSKVFTFFKPAWTEDLKIFDYDWMYLRDYLNKIYIDGKCIECSNIGCIKISDKRKHQALDIEVTISDIENVDNYSLIFWRTGLKKVPSLSLMKAKDLSWMFQGCVQLEEVPVIKFNWDIIEDMTGMFQDCVTLNGATLCEWDIQDDGTPVLQGIEMKREYLKPY